MGFSHLKLEISFFLSQFELTDYCSGLFLSSKMAEFRKYHKPDYKISEVDISNLDFKDLGLCEFAIVDELSNDQIWLIKYENKRIIMLSSEY